MNIGYWMIHEMIKAWQFKSKRLSFGNTLTTYLMRIDDEFPMPGDRTLPGQDDLFDILNVKGPDFNGHHHLTPSKERSSQSTLLDQMHRMVVITGDRFDLDFSSVFINFPPTPHSRVLFGDDSDMPDDEDINSADLHETDLATENWVISGKICIGWYWSWLVEKIEKDC
ncbi:hypothetical protein RND71_002247 [Anisodus tanguticus]|uniref:Uncharacterized protein n=1 Tax=Anisodus tanguticus TaxID=243964 RepID=A0AAE1T1K3_9SOLA|nr:hypothetical protein RND71_002247 [Anisodus tanguticus]